MVGQHQLIREVVIKIQLAMKTVFYLILCSFIIVTCTGQSKFESDKVIINQFFEALLNSEISDDKIISEFMNLEKADQSKIDFVRNHISSIRQELTNLKITSTDLKVIRYSDVKKEMRKIVVSEDKMGDVYLVYHKQEPPIPILIKEKKIGAFSVMDKGTRSYFIEY